MNCIVWAVSLCSFALLSPVAFSQDARPSLPPLVGSQAATITRAEVERALAVAPKTGIKDVALRVVPMGSGYNVGVFAVRRSLVNGKPIPDAYQHHEVPEI